MKHLKTKLMASVAMLMVATVMISSASFAWFTLSTQPEVSGVKTGLATSDALEIALVTTAGFDTEPQPSGDADTGKNVTWGNLVDVSAYFGDGTTATLRPVLVGEASALSAPTFGDDGRTSGSTALEDSYVAVSSDTDGTYKDGAIKIWSANDTAYAYQVDYFMRTNVADKDIVLLMPGEGVDLDRGNDVDGAGTSITDDTPCTVQFKVDDGAWVTYYDGGAEDPAWKDDPIVEGAAANTIYKVSMRVFWNGNYATNEDLAEGGTCEVNAQFTLAEGE